MNQITKNFAIEEFEKSSTAEKYGYNNKIPEKYRDNVERLAKILQQIRDNWGEAIIISSGYRCPELNKKVGGAGNSDHLYAAAADIHTVSDGKMNNHALWNSIICLNKLGKLGEFRQLINEYNDDWIHISVNNDYNKYKNRQILYVK